MNNGFPLILSDYQLGFLTAYVEGEIKFEDYRCQYNSWIEPDEAVWFAVQVEGRMFDIAIEQDEDNGSITATVYECFKDYRQPDEPYKTDMSHWHQLKVCTYD